jgi:N-acetylglucosamine malate deacetylase 1
MTNKNITIFAPHIDDEVIGVGGSIAKHKSLGNRINVIYFNSGRSLEEIEQRESESKKVVDFLNIDDCLYLRENSITINDGVLDKVVQFLRKNRSDLIYAPNKGDGDSEHVTVSEIAIRSQWMANNNKYLPHLKGKCNIKGVLLYEIHRPIQEVQYLEDISDFVDIKRQAIQLYGSQLEVTNYAKGIIGLNQYRGAFFEVGEAAEAFKLFSCRDIFTKL